MKIFLRDTCIAVLATLLVVTAMRWDNRARARVYVHVYDVRDLVRAEFEFERTLGLVPLVARGYHLADYLSDLIMAVTGPETWSDQGGAGVVTRWGGRLIILQSPDAHGEIERLLARLREGEK